MKRRKLKKIRKIYSKSIFWIFFIIFICGIQNLYSESFLNEDFADISDWEELIFPKIERHSTYSIDKDNNILEIKSDNSASGIIYKKKFDIYKYPIAEWKWKIEDTIKNGNALKKSGDDYSIRIYILFEYDKQNSKGGEKLKYGIAKLLYGKYPPHSALNYIWSNKEHADLFIENSFTERAVMIPIDSGNKKAGFWVKNRVNVYEDYKKAFNEEPPRYAYLAVMGDSDNTGGKSTAYIDFIKIFN